MAEAHSAVAFSFSITHEGWDVNFDREVLHLVWQSGIRSWKKRLARFQVGIILGLFMQPTSQINFASTLSECVNNSTCQVDACVSHADGNQ
ncbi:hypothetical protein Zmor_005353 [Zophobas morio]|uniref:Carnitine O-palmitoyltransferase N-terminal domain-containing protein n=1 Tax=Zophobas morio TaxID=2755281 RepID=A0AA38IVW3_9CUCU|nr:hypothetical protein Zmor_005353 [Zophobas morio]